MSRSSSAPISGWRRTPRQSASSSTPPRSMTRSESANLPMSCSSPAVCASSCSRVDRPTLPGDVAREGGDRGAVARGARVALVERADETAEHAPRQVRVLARALAGHDDEPRHVREGDHREQDEDEGREAELGVDRRRRLRSGPTLMRDGGHRGAPNERSCGRIDWPSSTAMSGTREQQVEQHRHHGRHGEQGHEARRCPGRGRALRRRPRRQSVGVAEPAMLISSARHR